MEHNWRLPAGRRCRVDTCQRFSFQFEGSTVTFSKPIRRPISGEEEHFLLEFAHFLSGVRSPASIAAYQSDIRLFAENTSGLDLLQVTDAQEDDYIASLQRLGLKRRTISRKGTAFRYYRQFLSRRRLTAESLNPVVESKAVDRKLGMKPSVFAEQNGIDEALSAFMLHVGENRSPATVRAYTCDLLKFHDCLRNIAKWHQVTKQLISDFLDQQITAGLNANSTARLLSTIRSLFVWLKQKGYIIGNPTLSLRVPRGGKKTPIPSPSDIRIEASSDIPSEFPALRDLVTFELLYRCGVGVSEISHLNVSSVDLKRRRLTIQGRRGRQRYIFLPEFLIGVLVSYLPRRQAMGDDNAPLVVNLRGGRLTGRSIGRVIERLAAAHKLPEGTHPHTLRHAYASHGLKCGKDVQDIRHGLGVSGVSIVVKIGN
jgi:integrase/recombinase XerC